MSRTIPAAAPEARVSYGAVGAVVPSIDEKY